MSKDKQIEEMAKDFDTIMQRRCFHISCNECEFDRYDTCKATMLATTLISDYGYRKASEVAREIFEEIDKRFEALLKFYPCNGEFEDAKRFVDFHWKHIRHSIMCDYDVDELKNKYTESSNEIMEGVKNDTRRSKATS